MRRWDRLLDSYIEEYRARGVSAASVGYTMARIERWGRWLKQRRPRVRIEDIDTDLITLYIDSCSTFRAKATVYGTLSGMRGFGDYLVRQGLWTINPLRWMKGPKGHATYRSITEADRSRPIWRRCGEKRRTEAGIAVRICG